MIRYFCDICEVEVTGNSYGDITFEHSFGGMTIEIYCNSIIKEVTNSSKTRPLSTPELCFNCFLKIIRDAST
jgi:hypothetical protein